MKKKYPYKLGWLPDKPDSRDRLAARAPRGWSDKQIRAGKIPAPSVVDLSPKFPPAYDQVDLGSCTANATCAVLQYLRRKESIGPDYIPSRLFEYYETRFLEGTTSWDAGGSIRDCMKAISNNGYCDERLWPYDTSMYTVLPDVRAQRAAALNADPGGRHIWYTSIPQTSQALAGALCYHLATGAPVVFGMVICESFQQPDSHGLVPTPKRDDPNDPILGGHALVLVGYDMPNQLFKFRNSWGTSWGQGGYGYMSMWYICGPDAYWIGSVGGINMWCLWHL
jgi:C1A family cysteine protease